MAQMINDIILNVIIGDWDYVHAVEVAELLTILSIIMIFWFIINLFKWFIYSYRRVGKGFM